MNRGATSQNTALNVLYPATAEVVGKVATLAFTIIAARTLSLTEFGTFAYAVSLGFLIQTLPQWGFGPLLIQRGAADPTQIPRLFTETMLWRFALGIPIFAIGGLIAAGGTDGPETVALWLVISATCLDLYSDTVRTASAAVERQGGTSIAIGAQRVSALAFIAIATVADGGLVGVALSYLCASVVGAVANALALRRLELGIAPRTLSRESLLLTARQSVAIALAIILGTILFRIDTVLLNAFRGDEAVAAYTVAYRFLETSLFLPWAVSRAILPVLSNRSDPASLRVGAERSFALLATVLLPFALVLVLDGRPVLDALFGARYAQESAATLAWLAFAPLLYAAAFVMETVLISQQRTSGMVIVWAAVTVGNILLNLWLIPQYSAVGAAIATSVSYAVAAGLLTHLASRITGRIGLLKPSAPAVASAAPCAVILVAGPGDGLPEIALALSAYVALWLYISHRFATDQFELIRQMVPARLSAGYSGRKSPD